jgi:replicative DNA helicase
MGRVMRPEEEATYLKQYIVKGGKFCRDIPPGIPALWGDGSRVVWAEGEPFILAGPDGVGKTTVGQQVALGLVGLRTEVLSMPVAERWPVLYLALDRPAQARRSIYRMTTDDQRDLLDKRMVFWPRPLLRNVMVDSQFICNFAKYVRAKVVIIDSLKDASPALASDEAGSAIANCFQYCVADGIDLMAFHHQRKQGQDTTRVPNNLEDVYGNRQITAAAGSVVMLWGQPGDEVVAWRHLKQPGEVVGPMNVVHEHETGTSTAEGWVDLTELAGQNGGLTVIEAAMRLFTTDSPDKKQVDKARRKLEKLVRNGRLMKIEGAINGKPPTTYRPYEFNLTDD